MTTGGLRILVCPQEFKGTLPATRAAEVIATAIRTALPHAEVIERPMADGGPGTAELIGRARGGESRTVTVVDAYGAPILASYVLIEGGTTAVIDSAAAVSLAATSEDRRAPLRSTSRGVGQLINAAAGDGARQIILGVGGTASSDGGAGAASTLGLRLLDATGAELPDGAAHLVRLARIEDAVPALLDALTIRIAVDVRNPLTGPHGAAAVYGAQKGVRDWQAPALDAAVHQWAVRVQQDLGLDVDELEGAGAGGGIPAGIIAALPDSTLESGAELVAKAIGLPEAMASVDLVVTGEGSLDTQTAFGKAAGHVAALSLAAGTPCLAVAGVIDAIPAGIADAEPLARTDEEVGAALAEPERWLAEATTRLIERWIASPTA